MALFVNNNISFDILWLWTVNLKVILKLFDDNDLISSKIILSSIANLRRVLLMYNLELDYGTRLSQTANLNVDLSYLLPWQLQKDTRYYCMMRMVNYVSNWKHIILGT